MWPPLFPFGVVVLCPSFSCLEWLDAGGTQLNDAGLRACVERNRASLQRLMLKDCSLLTAGCLNELAVGTRTRLRQPCGVQGRR